MSDEKRPITMVVEVAFEAQGDASLDQIRQAFEQHPMLPFYAGASLPMSQTIVVPTALRVDNVSEQDAAEPPRCPSCGHADGNHNQDVCQIPDCACIGARAA